MKFVCEKCGRNFDTEAGCIAHENEHVKIEAERQEKINKEKQSRENLDKLYKAYSDAVKKHNEEFGRKHAYYDTDQLKVIFGDPFFKSWRILD